MWNTQGKKKTSWTMLKEIMAQNLTESVDTCSSVSKNHKFKDVSEH